MKVVEIFVEEVIFLIESIVLRGASFVGEDVEVIM